MGQDHTACLLESRQAKDEKRLQTAILHFRQAFQQPQGRREFDLNDPDFLRRQERVEVLPGLPGEDPDSQARLRRQQEQLRGWSLQQHEELTAARHQHRLTEQQYDRDRVDLDTKALQLHSMEEQKRRAAAVATKDFNLAQSAERAERRRRERQQEEEDNRMDVQNQLQSELLRENLDQGTSTLGLARLRPDAYKGPPRQQRLELVHTHQQQAEERRRMQLQQQEEQQEGERLRLASARSGELLERQQARLDRQLRRELDHTNAQLAATNLAQKTELEKVVYTNVPEESYFSQFNTGSR